MDQSPLTLQTRPETFEPKVVQLYRRLFRDGDDEDKPEGFWRELFLLRPDTAHFSTILEDLEAIDLLHNSHHCEQFVSHGISYAKSGKGPADENALDTLTVFFGKVLSKRYNNPSSDIIEVLAGGLDNVDIVLTDLVATLDNIIKSGKTVHIRRKAVQVALCVASGAFQTGLLTYFTQRDLFPSLMKLIYDLEDDLDAVQPLLLAGMLANYNKFEAHNPYHVRFTDFAHEGTIKKMCMSIDSNCIFLRDKYVAIQEDVPESWSIGGTLSYIGLRALTGTKPAPPVIPEDEAKVLFAEQPNAQAGVLLTVYDYALANKVFCMEFVQPYTENKRQGSAMASYLSFCSYLYQHAYRSNRATCYAHLTLFILQILVEDPDVAKKLCETTAPVRLSRQRPPHLPAVAAERTLAANVIDVIIDSINHNLRKKLDVDLYTYVSGSFTWKTVADFDSSNVCILLRLITFLSKTRIRLSYHWSELWRSLLSFVRFLTVYAEDLRSLWRINALVDSLVNLITLSLTQGESFLPDSASYDDMFYKLVEFGDSLTAFRNSYSLNKSESAGSIGILIGVSKHYSDLIADQKGKSKNLSPKEVSRIIKEGYETLSIDAKEGLDHWEFYRETDHKAELKKVARHVCADARILAL